MDKKSKIENEVRATLDLLDKPVGLSISPDFADRVSRRAGNICLQNQKVMRYKIYALAAVLVVSFINVFAIARAMSQTKNDQSVVSSVMIASFEQSRLGVFWPMN